MKGASGNRLSPGVRAIASAVARGETTPEQVLEDVLQRVDATEPLIHAWTLLDRDVAREQARILTLEAKSGRFRGPLHGVPVAVKDEFHIAGMPTAFRGPGARIEPADATVVRKLREAGAIIVGKTTMPIGGQNPPTRNPWDLEHTPGGSSSGSGAVVGARVVPVAVAEQTGGSCLRPAAFCGVSAIKPTYGRISRYGCFPFSWSRDTVGLIGLDLADLALVLSSVSGYDPLDPTSLHEAPPPAELRVESLRPPRLGVVRNWFPERSEPYMNEAVETAAQKLAAAGATVEDLLLPEDFDVLRHAGQLVRAEAEAMQAGRREGVPSPITGLEFVPATYFVQARRIRTWMIGRLSRIFDELDGLIMPTAPGEAPSGLENNGSPALLDPWTFLGFPAINLNGGLSPAGLPLGIQMVAGPGQDHALLRSGAWAEQVLGVLPPPRLIA